MDGNDSGSSHRGIPRLSRIPQPRTAPSPQFSFSDHVNGQRASQLPRPSASASIRYRSVLTPTEPRSRPREPQYGPTPGRGNRVLPKEAVLPQDDSNVLETTPPSYNRIEYVEGDENSVADSLRMNQQKRKPRPSLSERTLETLSQVPPTPSPSRRRASIIGNSGNVLPQVRPSSSVANLRRRQPSPSKQAFKPPGRSDSSVKEFPLLPSESSDDVTRTPSRIAVAKSLRGYRTAAGLTEGSDEVRTTASRNNNLTSKTKSMYDLRAAASRSSMSRPSLAAVFKDPSTPGQRMVKSNTETYFGQTPNTSLLKPRSPGENVIASSSSIKTSKSSISRKSAKQKQIEVSHDKAHEVQAVPKSSLTLRETIAKAKAAKREAAKSPKPPAIATIGHSTTTIDDDFTYDMNESGGGSKMLQKRIERAVVTGHLNIAAMGFSSLPNSIHRMYDFDQDSSVNWSEAVDLTKLLASDNDLDELSGEHFPDWSIRELEEDDDKTNQFAGLQILDVRGNRLSQIAIGLRRLEQLHTLILSNNNLGVDALDIISQIPNLSELNLANNNLEGALPASLAALSQLQVLDLHSNSLTSLPSNITDLANLQKFDISDNKFAHIAVVSLEKLPLLELNLAHNSLSDTLFPQSFTSPKLLLLNVAFNQLVSLCDGNLELPKLQTLACDNNYLKILPNISTLKSLTTLTASENRLESLPLGFTELSNLRSVNLSVNQIRTLDPKLTTMDNLTSLNIAANPLRDRKYLAMNTEDLKASLMKRFGNGDTKSSGLSETNAHGSIDSDSAHDSTEMSFAFRPEKGILNMSSKNVTMVSLAAIELSQPIHTIRLSNNDLTEFPTNLLAHPMVRNTLKALDISHNQLLHSTDYLQANIALPALQSLNVVSTGLTSLEALTTFLQAPALRELNISCHRMTGPVPHVKASFPSLTTLLATDNWFTSIDVECLQGLEVVDVSNNDIDYLPPKVGELGNFEGSKAVPGRLRAFECSGNKFRVPRATVLEKGSEAVLRDLRRMVPAEQVGSEWQER